ncbi:sortase [candidate division WWE3 bacterium]|nr:sortase [candidate division WWE3 bacterium]
MESVSPKGFKKAGLIFLGLGLLAGLVQYFPVIKAEIGYQFKGNAKETAEVRLSAPLITNQEEGAPKDSTKVIIPESKSFGLVIKKLGINTPIIAQVDPFDSKVYQEALAKGIAHAKDTALPNAGGNTVLFAHSSDNFYNANRYNAVFYLLNKLETGDEIHVAFENKLYEYEVAEKKVVSPEEMSYMESSKESKLTLITCWPPGTTLKRLVVVAK